MKMLSISDEDRLQVNLQITKKLLITNQDCALNIAHPLQEDFLKGLYLRCLALVWKVLINFKLIHKIIITKRILFYSQEMKIYRTTVSKC